MRRRQRGVRGLLGAVLLAGTVAGCGSGAAPGGGGGASDDGGVVSVGAQGSGCALPMTFEAEKRWTRKSVLPTYQPSKPWPFSVVCQIDAGGGAKDTPQLTVYLADRPLDGGPTDMMDGFRGAGMSNHGEYESEEQVSQLNVGFSSAVEVTYKLSPPDDQKPWKVTLLLVLTPKGPMVLEVQGPGNQGPALKAYQRAKSTLQQVPS
ncbi:MULTISPECIES: lipoprotein [Streptomyces]|uniref:Lipoprotein n=1 Tax=Streptomyces yunnanensis TaxID=156453 RepID=A0ABY8AA41_9ACTN|nr:MULTISPECIES: lipoprotein [Streptomyces]AJC57545.1 lipoprotein [Streptomyces sp. 769]WEB41875.1 lipoprotein [Streptomyces yunnanensis]